MSQNISILLVDDEAELLENIAMTLEAADFYVEKANNGQEALNALKAQSFNLILADIAMPDMNGYQLLDRIRENQRWASVPFVFLTARKLDSDIRYGKSLGVDDYLTKPINAEDLLAVVQGKLRRAKYLQSQPQPQPKIDFIATTHNVEVGPLKMDIERHQVRLRNRNIKLSAREFALLEVFARNPNKVFSTRQLITVTHENLKDHGSNTDALVRSIIHSLRRKMGNYIENVRGLGYRLVLPEA
ncbi:MAG: response regulator transcription factor [Anaerolineae bacterium]|nr:response regulator transcription factor [Anaerolineae bacterium]